MLVSASTRRTWSSPTSAKVPCLIGETKELIWRELDDSSFRLLFRRDGYGDGFISACSHGKACRLDLHTAEMEGTTGELALPTSPRLHLWHCATTSYTTPRPFHDTTTTKSQVPLTQAVESVFLETPPRFLSEPVELGMSVCCCHESKVLHCRGLLISKQMFHGKHINRITCRAGSAFSHSSRADTSNYPELA